MYDNLFARTRTARRTGLVTAFTSTLAMVFVTAVGTDARAQLVQPESLVRKISGLSDKLELTTNTSRILTLDKNIPRVQVNNPELIAITPLSANQVQISAKKAGVTQVNLWDDEGNIHTVDVLIYGDARELEVALQTQFPHSTIKVYRYSESLVLKGYVDRPDYVSQIMRLAEDYAPKVINNINVGGVQQILLRVKVMEVSRTKLRDLGVDWAFLNGDSILAASNVSGLLQPGGSILSTGGNLTKVGGPIGSGGQTFQFGVFNGDAAFLGFLNALQEMRCAKTLAEPNLVAVSGRPAQFQVGGEFPILIPQSLGTTSVEFKPYGTQVDFLPIVLGNGKIRLEVRPRVSDIDPSLSVTLSGSNIPALTVRQIDTAVEMQAGQTFALGGLIQERSESLNTGLPYLSDMPIIGVPFRRTREKTNEIELLIMVTPEFVDGMDPEQVPCGGPGYGTTTPDNHDLYCSGYVEVPAHCNPIRGPLSCGDDCCYGGQGGGGCSTCGGNGPVVTDGMNMPGGVGYEGGSMGPTMSEPTTISDQGESLPMQGPAGAQPMQSMPDDIQLPPGSEQPGAAARPDGARSFYGPTPSVAGRPQVTGMQQYSGPRPYSAPRPPVFMRNASSPNNPQQSGGTAAPSVGQNGLIGPVGYDVE